jgi:hypothetical protein
MSPETTQILGAAATLYGLGGALSVLLQARRMRARGTSGDVSARFFAVYVGAARSGCSTDSASATFRSSWSTRWALCAAPSRWRSRSCSEGPMPGPLLRLRRPSRLAKIEGEFISAGHFRLGERGDETMKVRSQTRPARRR